MKTNISLIYVFVIGGILLSCENADDTNKEIIESNFYKNARISDVYPYIETGDMVVFNRYYMKEDLKEVADDEYSEDLYFEVAADIDSFNYHDSELLDLNINWNRYCFCAFADTLILKNGNITGSKNNNIWEISVDLVFQEGFQYSEDSLVMGELYSQVFNGKFSEKEIPKAR